MRIKSRLVAGIVASILVSTVIACVALFILRDMKIELERSRVYDEVITKANALNVLMAALKEGSNPSDLPQILNVHSSLNELLKTMSSRDALEESLIRQIQKDNEKLGALLNQLPASSTGGRLVLDKERKEILDSQLWMKVHQISDEIYRLRGMSDARIVSAQANAGITVFSLLVTFILSNTLISVLSGRKIVQSEDALRKSEEQFRVAQELSPDGFTILQPVRDDLGQVVDFTWVYENDTIARLNGTDAKAVVGRSLLELFPGHRDSQFFRAYQQVAESGKDCIFEADFLREDSTKPIWFRIVVVPTGENIAILAQDITERKQAEDALRASEERLASVMEKLREGLIIADDRGGVIYWNAAALAMFGYASMDECLRKLAEFADTFEVRTLNEDRPLPVADWPMSRVLGGEVLRDWEVRLRRLDHGWEKIFAYSGWLIRSASGEMLAFVSIIDITERKRAEDEQRQLLEKAENSRRAMLSILEDQKQGEEEIQRLNAELEQRVIDRTVQLEAANRELEAFSYSVSHDLRGPLRSIDGFCQALQEEYQEKIDKTGKTYLERVRKATERMGFLIDDMLKLSRVTRSELRRESIDLSKMVQAIAEANQQNNPDRRVDVLIREGIMFQGDPYLMQIVLDNLIGNAWKFTVNASHPRIEFGSTVKDGEPAYYIRDNGAGFDMAYVDKLFGAFQRLHSTAEFPGTGIGLATVQRIIYRHGGRVWAEGEVGKGATFYFTLPPQVIRS
jgi:PAS domain S-box-containing protein